MDLTMIATALSGANTALDVLSKLVGAHGDAKVQKATADLSKELGAANIAFVQATQLLVELQKENAALHRESQVLRQQLTQAKVEAESEGRYRLVELAGQQFAYLYEPLEGDPTPRHYLCARCRAEKKNSVLQGHGRPGNLKCVTCSTVYITDRDAPRPSTAGGTEYF
ncbi:hypothetical protein [Burkholderia gladioli]|uniref:hypothetical protein n=1 Tax=Burkholderia gladioli TaxID=28095 RepID=UPI00163FF237|nr:hypothetical protein [Burkholderia gladioli]